MPRPVFVRAEIFELRFTVVEGVTVFVVTIVAGRGVHDFAVHLDSVCPTVANEPAGGVEAVAGAHQPPVVVTDAEVIVFVNDGKDARVKRY